ncbi:MAG TPA: Ig-like domain-containing protein, partial [Verrucomicrobiae bacterium]
MKLKQSKLSFRATRAGLGALLLSGLLAATAQGAITTNIVFSVQPVSTVVGASLGNVTIQLRDSRGTNAALAGVAVNLSQSKGAGLTGTTVGVTDATGKAVFTNLVVTRYGLADALTAATTAYKTVVSSAFNITQGRTTTTVSAPTNGIYGQSLTLMAAVGLVSPAAGTPTGLVTFRDGSAILGSNALTGTTSSFVITSRLLAGTHSFSASYSGDTNFAASTSAGFSV